MLRAGYFRFFVIAGIFTWPAAGDNGGRMRSSTSLSDVSLRHARRSGTDITSQSVSCTAVTMTWLRRVLACAGLAVFTSAFSGDLPHSPYTDAAVAAGEIIGVMLLGWYARWSSIWLFSVALVSVTTLHERFFWTDNPQLSGMDDIGPTGVVLALPVAWVLLAVSAAARTCLDVRRRPSGKHLEPAASFAPSSE